MTKQQEWWASCRERVERLRRFAVENGEDLYEMFCINATSDIMETMRTLADYALAERKADLQSAELRESK